MSIRTHLERAAKSAHLKSIMKARYTKPQQTKRTLEDLYENATINEEQGKAIKMLHIEHTAKQRKMMEDYMERELDIIQDFAGKYKQKVVGPDGKEIIK